MENNKEVTETFKFKTNINCGGCISNVTPALNELEGVCDWEVDTSNKDKILTVQSEGITEAEIKEAVRKAGYKIERI